MKELNIFALCPGYPVIFSAQGGYEAERQRACTILEIGAKYIIRTVDVDSWYTSVTLEGVPDKVFNSCLFSQVPSLGEAES